MIKKCSRLFDKRLVFTVLLLFLTIFVRAQGGMAEAIGAALRAGDATGVSRYFGPSVDITIHNATSTYSRTQGELVLRDFFSKNEVRNFEIQHSEPSSARPVNFTIGYLHTGNGRYKVLMWLRPRDGGYVLKEIRFEK